MIKVEAQDGEEVLSSKLEANEKAETGRDGRGFEVFELRTQYV